MTTKPKLGIIQSRGLGDIVIALPIAKHYYDKGYEVYWPVCEEFWYSVKDVVPWINWTSLPIDPKGDFYYEEPMRRLTDIECDEIVCLYQSLNVYPELSAVPYFQIQHFDEFKYTKARVPLLKKWTLSDCLIRNEEREQALLDKLIPPGTLYYVTHLEGSNFKCEPDLGNMPANWLRVDITGGITDCVFDWLKIIEGAQAIICLDSVISNIVDQLQIEGDKYWIPRSHIHITPVLGTEWTILEPAVGSMATQQIFQAAK